MIRKILNLPNKTQKAFLQNNKEIVLKKCDVIARKEIEEQQDNKLFHDGQCPICKSRKNIINRIVCVQNTGNINIKISFINIKGIMIINTREINHCNSCSNEWEKYKTKPISQTNILYIAFKYLKDILNNPENKRDWKMETIQVFENSYAETLYELNKWIRTDIKLSVLRQHYKSIYDKSRFPQVSQSFIDKYIKE
jgi:hypothetical protein